MPTAFAVALVLGCAVAPLRAQEPTALQRMLGNLGLLLIPSDDPIDYRERAPLVVPPSSDLPVPYGVQDVATAVPDWPTDPEIVDRQKQRELAKRPVDSQRDAFYSGRKLTPAELRLGTTASRRQTAPGETVNPEFAGRERQTDSRGIFGWFSGADEKPVQFAGEPPRVSLTDPPSGYRTPSPNAPYGVVQKDKPGTRIGSPFDRLLAPGDPIGPQQ